MTKEEANRIIAEKVQQAHDLIGECEEVADNAGITFNFSVEYGMGGTYYPRKVDGVEKDLEWYGSDEGWVSSSQNC